MLAYKKTAIAERLERTDPERMVNVKMDPGVRQDDEHSSFQSLDKQPSFRTRAAEAPDQRSAIRGE